jgi:hypothetical protein
MSYFLLKVENVTSFCLGYGSNTIGFYYIFTIFRRSTHFIRYLPFIDYAIFSSISLRLLNNSVTISFLFCYSLIVLLFTNFFSLKIFVLLVFCLSHGFWYGYSFIISVAEEVFCVVGFTFDWRHLGDRFYWRGLIDIKSYFWRLATCFNLLLCCDYFLRYFGMYFKNSWISYSSSSSFWYAFKYFNSFLFFHSRLSGLQRISPHYLH